MAYKRLLVWVEGEKDAKLFNSKIKPEFKKKYDWVEIRTYKKETKKYITNLLKSIKAISRSYPFDYVLVTDIDSAPCVTRKKKKIENTYKGLDRKRIMVVIKEIEGWYLAGLSNRNCKKLGIRSFATTDNVTKEEFNKVTPRKFDSEIDFMIEILKHFSIPVAKLRNKSFDYFTDKYKL